jgi:anti-anti-sigma regulatory factor
VRKFSVAVLDAEVLVCGDIDPACVPSLRAAMAATAPGPLIVDLRGVTFLNSAGIHPLLDVADRGLTVVVRAGSVAARLLAIVGLGDRATVVHDAGFPR